MNRYLYELGQVLNPEKNKTVAFDFRLVTLRKFSCQFFFPKFFQLLAIEFFTFLSFFSRKLLKMQIGRLLGYQNASWGGAAVQPKSPKLINTINKQGRNPKKLLLSAYRIQL